MTVAVAATTLPAKRSLSPPRVGLGLTRRSNFKLTHYPRAPRAPWWVRGYASRVAIEVAESRFGAWLKRSETRIFTDVGGFGCVGRSTFQISSLTITPERR